ncbi:MAG TPA: outer membrane protein transport protein [Anaeromyxobacter sp.]
MKKLLGIVAVAAVVAAAPAYATNGMRMIGFGPVQDSMGGASVAAPLDGATAVTNPAGLSGLAPRLDLAAQAFMPDVKYSFSAGGGAMTANGSSDRPTDYLPTIAGVFKVQDQLTVGFAALGTAGMGVDYSADPNGDKLYTSYMNARIAPAASYRVNDQFSVGLALNLMYAQMGFEMAGNPKFSNTGSFGYGATIGVTYAPIEMVTVGLAYETQSTFQDFKWSIAGTDYAVEFNQPMVATLGVAVRPAAGLLLAIDGEWINWSAVMGKDQPKFTKPAGAPSFDMGWKDQMVVKVGAQYEIPSLKELKVRAGYNYGASPLDKERPNQNMAFPAVSEHHFTLGAGYDIGKVSVLAAFVYSPEAKITASIPAMGVDSIESKMSQTAFELGGTYRF